MSIPEACARPSRATGRLAGPRDSLVPRSIRFEESCPLLTLRPSFPWLDRRDGLPTTAPHQTLIHTRYYQAFLDRIATHQLSAATSAGVLFVAQHHDVYGSSSSLPMAY